MTQPFDDFWFVGCPARLGQIKKIGPVSGCEYVISPRGIWVQIEDAEIMLEETQQIWCFRQNGWLTIHPVILLSPTIDNMAEKPQEVF